MKIFWVSLGCARNWVDSEIMIDFSKKEHTLVDSEKSADLCVVNTCGFLKKSREESLLAIKDLLKKNKKVIVTGCMVAKHLDLLKSTFKEEIHCYLGPGDLDQILKAIKGEEKEIISKNKSYLKPSSFRTYQTPKHLAYVKIAEGCSKLCSYCIIPKIKGGLKSKEAHFIIQEIKELISQGVKEINLVAQDLTDWGKDLKNDGLIYLLKEILKIPNYFWLRLLYVYPDSIPIELFDIMKQDKRLLPYIDFPLQHISDNILKKMNRKCTESSILKLLDQIREKIPKIAIRTTFIVGFPEESEKDFNKLLKFVEKQEFDHVGVFPFSKEPLAKASCFKGQILEKIKIKRQKILLETQAKIVLKKNQTLIGEEVEVLFESYHKDSNLLALSRSYRQSYEIDSNILINDIEKIPHFHDFGKVKIKDILGYDLLGEVIS